MTVTTTKVYVRSVTHGGFTSMAIATINLAFPPTSPDFQMVISGAADPAGAAGTQNSIDGTFTQQTMNNGTVIIRPSLIDVIYGP